MWGIMVRHLTAEKGVTAVVTPVNNHDLLCLDDILFDLT
jgi:hypothetical protein